MSGILKSIGKVFKKILKSPIFKAVLIAVAVYFTAGLALGAMGATFAASLPGIAGAAEGLGITAGAFGSTAAATAGVALESAGVAATSMEALLPAAEGSAAIEAASTAGAGVVDSGLAAAGGEAAAGAATDAGSLVGSGAASTAGVDAGAGAATDAATTQGALGIGESGGVDAASGATDAATQAVNAGAGVDTTAATTPVDNSIGGLTQGQAGITPSNGLDTPMGATKTALTQGQAGIGPSGGGVDTQAGGMSQIAQQASGGDSGLLKWWKGLDSSTQQLAYKGLSDSAKAVINSVSQKANLDAIQKQRDQERADIIRRGGVPDLTASYRPAGGYKTPGIINSGTGGA